MSQRSLKGKWALVTGASSGLGADIARHLATRGCNVILVARRQERLMALQQEVEAQFGVQARVVPLDLIEPGAPDRLYAHVKGAGLAVDVLVNNAGFGLYGRDWEIPWEQEQAMLRLNMVVLTHLTRLFLPEMLARNAGCILQVSSYGAFLPTPTYASYSATKSYVQSYSEALRYELRSTRVQVTILAPGIVATEFHDVSGQELTLYQRLTRRSSADVARAGVEGMLKGETTVIPDLLTRLTVLLARFLPRRIMIPLVQVAMTVG